jgi:hypothetical protein
VGRSVALGLAIVALAAGPAAAGPAGGWTRVTDPGGRNIDQIGLARTVDGVLHVAWTTGHGAGPGLFASTISPAGEPGGAPVPIQTGWETMSSPALLATPTGLLALWGGQSPGSGEGEVYAATAAADGASWSFAGRVSPLDSDAYASDRIGAATGTDGTPLFSWSLSFRLITHLGLDSSTPNQTWQTTCCAYVPGIGVDAATGDAVLGWFSNATNDYGIWTQTIAPGGGGRAYLPGSGNAEHTAAVAPDQTVGITGRIGSPGVYVAYGVGYPTWTSLWIWEHGSATATRVWNGRVLDPNLTAGPGGRLWVMWHTPGNEIYAMRSNPDATHWGSPVRVVPPAHTDTIWKLTGEGSGGPLDLFASASTPESLAYWHRRVLPALTLACAGGKVVRCTVADAGDPVKGARVRLGGKTLATNLKGKVQRDLSRGSYIVVASKSGYTAASARVRAI